MRKPQQVPEEFPGQVRREVFYLRLDLGMNQEQFAKLMGVSRQIVSYWETGKYRPHPARWAEIKRLRFEYDRAHPSREGVYAAAR